jgi:glutathione S-transferase
MSVRAGELLILGAPGSPYTRKMLAVLRYKRIAYRYLNRGQAEAAALPRPKLELLPTLYFPRPDGGFEPAVDSTPLIRRLDAEAVSRAVVPADPAIAFIDALIEDYADEWLTKAMFHFRWHYAADRAKSGRLLPLHQAISAPAEALELIGRAFTERQVGRLRYVGSSEVTAPVIEASYARFLAIFDAILAQRVFLFGERPAAADFALFGQLSQLAHFDPTPEALTLCVAPRTYAWVAVMEDLSGVADSAAWVGRDAVPAVLRGLLGEIGRVYVPVLLANERAIAGGAALVETEIDGLPWKQNPFPYHVRCLAALRGLHAGLTRDDRRVVDGWLEGTGAETLFVAG